LSKDGIDKSLSLLINALSLWMSLFDTCLTRLQLYRVTGRTTLLTLFFLLSRTNKLKRIKKNLRCVPLFILNRSRETEMFSGSNVKSNNQTKKRCRQVSIPDCNWSLHYRNLLCLVSPRFAFQ